MRFSFSILRLLLSVAILAIAFALTMPLGEGGIFVAVAGGIPVAVIVLIATKRDLWPILQSYIWCGIGMIPVFMLPFVSPPYEPGDEIRYAIVGAIIGWSIGIALSPGATPKDGQS